MNPSNHEFRRGWRVLAAASLGVACGCSPIPFYTIGVLAIPLGDAFGWGRGDVMLAILPLTVGLIITVPLIGALADRIGVRPVVLGALIGFGLSWAAMAAMPGSLTVYYALWLLMGLLGAGSSPVGWTRGVVNWFVRHRGLALAITLMGTGVTALLLPAAAAWLVDAIGWRGAILVLALLPLGLALPVAWRWFHAGPQPAAGGLSADGSATSLGGIRSRLEPDPDHSSGLNREADCSSGLNRGPDCSPGRAPDADLNCSRSPDSGTDPGLGLTEALRDYRFWVLTVVILLVAIQTAGSITNLVPLLQDRGYGAAEAAGIAGVIGISIIVGRLVTGYLIDRYWAPGIAFPLLVLPAFACLALTGAEVAPGVALLAAVAIGLAAGAETDLVAFLVARYFGLRHYGRIYGLQYAVFAFASGIAPFAFGRSFDLTGNYDTALYVAAAMVVVGACLLLTLGRYPEQR